MTTMDFVTPEQHEALAGRVTVLEGGGAAGLGDAVLLGGQSNQSGRGTLPSALVGVPAVRMLGNDYVIKQAAEPVDSETGQLDAISLDAAANKHGKNLQMGLSVNAATGRPVLLIPAALGGVTTAQWAPSSPNPFNRGTLHGSMLHRAAFAESAGYVPRWLDWIQGEQDASNGVPAATFISNTRAIWDAVRAQYPGLPVLYAQLGARNGADSGQYWAIREAQRLMGNGSGDAAAVRGAWMVVMHDLPLIDVVHLNTAGYLELGKRFALMARQRVYGQAVDGMGPRLRTDVAPLVRNGGTISVRCTQPVTSHATYDHYFSVQDGATMHTLTSGGITSISRDGGDQSVINLTLAAAPAGAVTVHYQPPDGRAAGVWMANVVRGQSVPEGLTYGLPLPAFSVTV